MISVIIPVYNDPEGLRDTLESVVNQSFEGDYEILPVDNNSTDSTREIIRKFEEDYPDLVRGLEENKVQSSYAARNKGIEESKGEILCFIDADMWVEDNYLSKIEGKFSENKGLMYAGCKVEKVIQNKNIFSRYRAMSAFDIENNIKGNNYAPTCCLIVRRKIFDEVGKFDHRLISKGDIEFGKRCYETGIEQNYLEDITLYHPTRSSIKSLIKRQKRVGKGKAQFRKLHPEKDSFRSGWNPMNFLPGNPLGMKDFLDSSEKYKPKKHELPLFYLIYYILKLQMYGSYNKQLLKYRLNSNKS